MKSSLYAWIVAFFTPLLPLTLIVGLFILFDTYMGRKAVAVKAREKGKNPRDYVTSRKTRTGLFTKLIMYNFVLLSVHLIDLFVIGDLVADYLPWKYTVTRFGVVVLCWIEFDSIDEKYYRIHGVTLTSVIKDKIDKIKSIFLRVKMIKK
jgi:hypothetical protein